MFSRETRSSRPSCCLANTKSVCVPSAVSGQWNGGTLYAAPTTFISLQILRYDSALWSASACYERGHKYCAGLYLYHPQSQNSTMEPSLATYFHSTRGIVEIYLAPGWLPRHLGHFSATCVGRKPPRRSNSVICFLARIC